VKAVRPVAQARARRESGRNTRLVLVVVLTCAAVLLASAARADTPPSVWDVARDPAVRDRWALHVRVERLLAARTPSGESQSQDRELRLEAALALLLESDAATGPDRRLRYDLGIVYHRLAELTEREDLRQRAVEMLTPALDAPLDDPSATEALEALVYSFARLNRPRDELDAWHHYIPRLAADGPRAVAMMNMGEAQMRLGRVDDALVTFRDVLGFCGSLPNSISTSSTYVLDLWDVAVALDRSGDFAGALASAAKASGMRVGNQTGRDLIENDPGVFFVPDWEREWYLGLADASAARAAADPRDAARAWGEAERHWGTYVARSTAAPHGDPWLAIAHARLDQMRAARAAAQGRVAKPAPSKPPTTGRLPRLEP